MKTRITWPTRPFEDNRLMLKLDDVWNFQVRTTQGGGHTYAVLESQNKKDPDIIVDPLNDIVRPVPKPKGKK